jgi:hypothetical protein
LLGRQNAHLREGGSNSFPIFGIIDTFHEISISTTTTQVSIISRFGQ